MFSKIGKVIFGSSNDRQLNKLRSTINKINDLEKEISKLDKNKLIEKTKLFKNRINNGEDLDSILPEAFAVVREASKRTLKQRHFDVQLVGGIVLHQGKIAEMKTGEGKTLVSTLPSYLNSLTKKGVHIVTVNDYLAKRDSEWMGEIYKYLEVSVGCITNEKEDAERKSAYDCDITYGTNNEFGFDYLRDNMKFGISDMVQRPFNFAIIDEVDSILIDEARTPLIISGQAEDSSVLYNKIDKIIPQLSKDDYELDEKQRTCNLTENGILSIEKLLIDNNLIVNGSLYDVNNVNLLHHINSLIKNTHSKKKITFLINV